MQRPVRLPLEVGVTALFDLAIGVALFPLGLALTLVGLAGIWFLGADAGDAMKVPATVAFVGGALAVFGVRLILRAWRARPADIVFEDTRFRVHGGPAHGYALGYDTIDPAKCVLRKLAGESDGVAEAAAHVLGTDQMYRLTVHAIALAEGDAPDEIESMREVLAAILARAPAGAAAGEHAPEHASKKDRKQARRARAELAPAPIAAPTTTGVLACEKCGGLVAPSDDDHVACPSCGANVAMPSDVRARVRATAEASASLARIARSVTALLDQPGARSTTILLALSLVVIGGAWPLAVWGFTHLIHGDRLSFARGAALSILPLVLIADGFFLSRARLVDRHALGTLVIGFAAQAPATPGAPPTCRACGAPLPADAATVVRCVFCSAANLTGVDLRALAGRTASSSATLETALSARARRRRAWRLRTLAMLPLVAITVWILRDVVAR